MSFFFSSLKHTHGSYSFSFWPTSKNTNAHSFRRWFDNFSFNTKCFWIFSLSSFIPLLVNTIYTCELAKILTQQIICCTSVSSTNFPILASDFFSYSFALMYSRVGSQTMFCYCRSTFLNPLHFFMFLMLKSFFVKYVFFIEKEKSIRRWETLKSYYLSD